MRRIGTMLLAGAIPLFFLSTSHAGAMGEVEIPVDSVVRGDPGSTVEVASVAVDPELVGHVCDVGLEWENNHSTHPNNDLIITTGSSPATVADIETESESITTGGESVVLGPTIVVDIRLGADGVSSGGLRLGFECQPAPPVSVAPTSVVISSTTTLAPTTTSTTVAPVVVLPETLEAPVSPLPQTAVAPAVVAQPTYTG